MCRITYNEQCQMILDVEIKRLKTDFKSSRDSDHGRSRIRQNHVKIVADWCPFEEAIGLIKDKDIDLKSSEQQMIFTDYHTCFGKVQKQMEK